MKPLHKLRSSANSLRHGMLARTVVLEDENLQFLCDLLAAFQHEPNLIPNTPIPSQELS
jgi:hypothetical protein